MIIRAVLLTTLFFSFSFNSYVHASTHLEVVIPETDTVHTDLSRYRIAANTQPGSRAFINGREVKVYPTGAFVGLVTLQRGKNVTTLMTISSEGDSLSRDLVFLRDEAMTTSPTDPLVIEEYHMQPLQDHWLNEGDVLEVRFKGSPGYEATFDIEGVKTGISMRELSPTETDGVRGIYVGHYEVAKGDYTHEVPIRFRLRKSFWSSVEAESPGRVSIMPEQFPLIAEVRGVRPFLNVGLGTDRLGGARLGFIVPGILLQLDGKIGNMFRVRLSNDMTAWIQSQFVDILSSGTPPPRALAGSISAAGSPAGDVISLQIGQKLPYLTRQLINPNRIVIDIFGATSNTTWVTQHLSAEGIGNITWDQVSTEQYRLQIELNHPLHWGHRIEYTDIGNMHVIIRRPPARSSQEDLLYGRFIAIDAGHGGNNKGALGATGVMEKDITLAISKLVEKILIERGATVVMTRTGDYDVSMRDRIDKLILTNPEIVVSIHCNSVGYATDPERVLGTSTFYKHIGYKPLADVMYRELLSLGFAEFGMIGSFNFLLNDMVEIPNVLIETAFLSNPEDEMKLIDEDMQKKIAIHIVKGLEQFFSFK